MNRDRIRQIEEAYDLNTLEIISAVQLLNFDFARALRQKADANKETNYPLICKQCENTLIVPMHPRTREYYFKHLKKHVECIWTDGRTKTIDKVSASIFRGKQEGPLHLAIKNRIGSILHKCIDVDQFWVDERYDSLIVKEHKKPDLRFTYKGKVFVFEIQLATTQRPIITKRNNFYKREGFHLLWITANVESKDLIDHKASVIDIITDHNDNLFSVDSETFKQSEAENTIILRVHWWERGECKNKLVKLDELKYRENNLPYIIDKPKIWHEAWKDKWISITYDDVSNHHSRRECWEELIEELDLKIDPEYLEKDSMSLMYTLNLLISIDREIIIGTRQNNYTQILNTFLSTESRKPYAKIINYCLKKASKQYLLQIDSTKKKMIEAIKVSQVNIKSTEVKIIRALFPYWSGT